DGAARRGWIRRGDRAIVAALVVAVAAGAVLAFAGAITHAQLAVVVVAAALVAGYAAIYLRRSRRLAQADDGSLLPGLAAAIGSLALPLLAVAAGKVETGAYTHRYVLPTAVGVAVLLPLALSRLDGGRRLVSVVVGVALVLVVLRVFWYQHLEVST